MKLFNNLQEKWDEIRYINKLTIIFIIGIIFFYNIENGKYIDMYLIVGCTWIIAVAFYKIHLDKKEAEKIKKEKENENTAFGKMMNKTMEDDELYNKAKEIVINSGKSSAAFLQRNLNIGYASAARLQEALEEKGVIGKHNGANQRDVFVKKQNEDKFINK